MATYQIIDPKPHICPPSSATHPRDRWESLFVYSFICKFTNLRGKDGLDTPMESVLSSLSGEVFLMMRRVSLSFQLRGRRDVERAKRYPQQASGSLYHKP